MHYMCGPNFSRAHSLATMTVRTGPGVEEEFAALVPVLRRFLARRVPPDDVDDLVQDAVAKVLARRPDLTGEALAAYSVVTARNLVVTAARQRRRRGPHEVFDPLTDKAWDGLTAMDDPLAALVTAEERVAIVAALDQLAESDRAAVLGREGGASTGELARRMGTSPGAVAVRLARARAKLRVDYLVALEHASLPTPRCRPVLLALSAHDQQAQRATAAGHHLVDCTTCAALAPPLLERRRPVAFVLPMLAGRRALRWMRRRPRTSAAAGVVVALVALAVWSLPGGHGPATPACPPVLVGGQAVPMADHGGLAARAGTAARGTALPVLDVPADEGFWVGCGGAELWVQLVGDGESLEEVRPGMRVDVVGRTVAHGAGFATTVGVEGDAGHRLDEEAVHLEVAYSDLTMLQPAP